MDRKLIFTEGLLNCTTADFYQLKSSIPEITFEIWNDIPKKFLCSYYENEQIVNPVKKSFEDWKANLVKRPEPLYSVALSKDSVVSSVYGAVIASERIMNLWATKSEFREKRIGKIVLLNFIRYCFENNPDMQIKAWDVTSQRIDTVLTNMGFT